MRNRQCCQQKHGGNCRRGIALPGSAAWAGAFPQPQLPNIERQRLREEHSLQSIISGASKELRGGASEPQHGIMLFRQQTTVQHFFRLQLLDRFDGKFTCGIHCVF